MTLQEGEPGNRYTVKSLKLPVELERRLEALGLLEGSRVELLRKKKRGAVIVTVRGTRFAMGYGIATQIQVEKEAGPYGA